MSVFEDRVIQERQQQDAQWGGPEHDDRHTFSDWLYYIERQALIGHDNDPHKRSADRFVKIGALCRALREWAARGAGSNR